MEPLVVLALVLVLSMVGGLYAIIIDEIIKAIDQKRKERRKLEELYHKDLEDRLDKAIKDTFGEEDDNAKT